MRAAARILNPEDRHPDLLGVMPAWNRRDETNRKTPLCGSHSSETTNILARATALMRRMRWTFQVLVFGSPATVIARKTADYDLTVIGAVGAGFKSADGRGARCEPGG